MSLERLQLMAAPAARLRALKVLDLGQAIGAALSDSKAWQTKQKELIKRAQSPT